MDALKQLVIAYIGIENKRMMKNTQGTRAVIGWDRTSKYGFTVLIKMNPSLRSNLVHRIVEMNERENTAEAKGNK